MGIPIDDGPGDGEDAEFFSEVRKLGGFNSVSADKVTLHGELVCQAHGRRAVRSSGGGEHLQVKRLGELSQFLAAFRLQS